MFAFVLLAINWHWDRTVQSGNVTTSVVLDGGTIAGLLCAILLMFLAWRFFRLLRSLLDRQVRVPREVKLFSWGPLFFLLPLLFRFDYSLSISDSSTSTTVTEGYGSSHASLLMVLAGILIIFFQMYCVLRNYWSDPAHEEYPVGQLRPSF